MSSALAGGVRRTPAAAARPGTGTCWFMAAILVATIAGFWPTFVRRLDQTDLPHLLHGVSALLWIVLVGVQSWLAGRRLRQWHRRVALAALVLLVVLVSSALYMVGVMQHNPQLPPPSNYFFGFIDLMTMGWLLLLVGLGFRNRHRPAAHRRYMTATALLGLPAALTRLYLVVLFPGTDPLIGFHASLVSVEVILSLLILLDWRQGQQQPAYPLSLAFYLGVQFLIGPVSASPWWQRAMTWYGSWAVFR